MERERAHALGGRESPSAAPCRSNSASSWYRVGSMANACCLETLPVQLGLRNILGAVKGIVEENRNTLLTPSDWVLMLTMHPL